jgi:hypothetical protein
MNLPVSTALPARPYIQLPALPRRARLRTGEQQKGRQA